MSTDVVDIVVDQLRNLSDSEKLLALARIGATPKPLANNVVKLTLRLKPGREGKGEPPPAQRPREEPYFFIRDKAKRGRKS